jgi:hypothetical protein
MGPKFMNSCLVAFNKKNIKKHSQDQEIAGQRGAWWLCERRWTRPRLPAKQWHCIGFKQD